MPPDLKELEKVSRMVRQFLRPDYDREGISAEIICEAIIKGVEHISRKHVRDRCTDVYRRRLVELKANEKISSDRPIPPTADVTILREDLVDNLTQVLSVHERKVIFLIFYQGLTPREVAVELKRKEGEIRHTLGNALFKMRQV